MNRWGASAETFDDAASAPLGLVNFPRTVGVDLRESRAQSARHEHILQKLVAAVDHKPDDLLVLSRGIDQLLRREGVRIINVDQFEDLARRGHELRDEPLVLRSTQRGSTLLVGA